MTLEAAYEECRAIARREAKNFYYSFRVLPQPKRDAMCAVYAFMRQADDIADDETRPLGERRVRMEAWLQRWRASRAGAATADPVFTALSDTQMKFGIADALLADLVRGTTMDLQVGSAAGPSAGMAAGPAAGLAVDVGDGFQGYETFEDLYRYCYLVASVVGLVCIRVFGYSDPAAESMAERTGVAFQLTNILRDIKEDAERKRIYLPQALLREFGVTNAHVLELCRGRTMKTNERAMLMALSVQAWEYYESGRALLGLLDADSRACLWVMTEIYSGLLGKIDRRQGDVFSERVSLPPARKLFVLFRGMAMALRARG